MKVVTVHRGARDFYQLSCALAAAGLLRKLVTDLYWPADRRWAAATERMLPVRIRQGMARRNAAGLPSKFVESCYSGGLFAFAAEKSRLPFRWRRAAIRLCDHLLGRRAAEVAERNGDALLSYSYYAHSAFSHVRGNQPKILFQLHPHPAAVRAILDRERLRHPECAQSLSREWELALPGPDFARLAAEPRMADYWLAASSFTRNTLCDAGIPAARIHVIPYGTDLQRFSPARGRNRWQSGPLRLLFVGTAGQRKGIRYLLDALDRLRAGTVELTVCGRVEEPALVRNRRQSIRVRGFVSDKELVDVYRAAHVFVLPSLAEGFGHVLLEAMACGLPIIGTTHTAAPDLIADGQEGFIIEPADAEAVASRIDYFLENPPRVQSMGEAARSRAEYFSWSRFRAEVAEVVPKLLAEARQNHDRQGVAN
jgi:glycosyltransferase involved in cell wall biosynthesis